jgi:hypothetical protein
MACQGNTSTSNAYAFRCCHSRARYALVTTYKLAEMAILQARWRWNHPERFLAHAAQRLAIWQNSRLVETRMMAKERIKVDVPEKPLNLMLVYLGSFGLRLIDNPKWPGLTPTSALLRDHVAVYSMTPLQHAMLAVRSQKDEHVRSDPKRAGYI